MSEAGEKNKENYRQANRSAWPCSKLERSEPQNILRVFSPIPYYAPSEIEIWFVSTARWADRG